MRDEDDSEAQDDLLVVLVAVVIDELDVGAFAAVEHQVVAGEPFQQDAGDVAVL